MLFIIAERDEKLAEELRDRLLSASHINDEDEDAGSHSVSASSHINDSCQNRPTGLFRKSVTASKSHRRAVSRDSDSDEDCIGPPQPVVSTGSSGPEPSALSADNSEDEIGPPVPTAATLQNNKQSTDEQHRDSDDEIGPSLPDAAASVGRDDFQEDKVMNDDDYDDDDDAANDEVAISVFICSCI